MYNKRGFKRSKVRNYRKKKTYTNIKKMIRSEVLRSQETKELTYTYSNVGSSNFSSISYGSGAVVAGFFGAISQGVNDGQRIGNSLYARGININFALQNATGDGQNYLRFIIFQARKGMATNIQPSSTSSFVQSVLSNSSASVTQWLQPVDTDRFEVLCDKTYWFRNLPIEGNSALIVPQTHFFKKFLKINRKMQWDDSGVINNDVYMIAISDSALSPNPGAVAGFVRVYYKDA